jgi:hypothetical protein
MTLVAFTALQVEPCAMNDPTPINISGLKAFGWFYDFMLHEYNFM